MIFSNWDQNVYYPKTEKFVRGKVLIKKKHFRSIQESRMI